MIERDDTVICGYCNERNPTHEMTIVRAKFQCDGCGEAEDDFNHDDPHGKDWCI